MAAPELAANWPAVHAEQLVAVVAAPENLPAAHFRHCEEEPYFPAGQLNLVGNKVGAGVGIGVGAEVGHSAFCADEHVGDAEQAREFIDPQKADRLPLQAEHDPVEKSFGYTVEQAAAAAPTAHESASVPVPALYVFSGHSE